MSARQPSSFGVVSLGLLLLVASQLPACSSSDGDRTSAGHDGGAEPAQGAAANQGSRAIGDLFVDEAARVGLDFVHVNGMSGRLYIAEVMGPGAALFDYDGDGDLDLYLTQGRALDERPDGEVPEGEPRLTDRLYRNDLESGELRFTDVTAEAGIDAPGYGMGVAVADIDRDGDLDLYVTNLGPNQLWRNRGDGTFEDVTATAGAGDERWSTAATFFDYDRDTWPDLFIGNFIDFTVAGHKDCTAESSAPDYCSPTVYQPVPDRLLHNRGDGTFEDVTATAGLDAAWGNALGAVAGDLDGDGWPDLYVANDSMANQMWINGRDGTLTDQALLGGSALSREGRAQASMGVDAADFDADGDLDLFMTHLNNETNTLYLNRGDGLFEDRGLELGLASPSLPYTSFGTRFFDYDNDGWLDLMVINGEVKKIWAQDAAGDPLPLKQPGQLFRNLGDGHYEEVSDRAGRALTEPVVGRAAAFGDVDDDGDLDVVVTVNNGPVRLLVNHAAAGRRWLGLALEDSAGLAVTSGASVAVELAGSRELWRAVRTDGSYLAAHDPRLLFGLGSEPVVEGLRVYWPDGSAERFPAPPLDAYSTLRQGGGSLIGP